MEFPQIMNTDNLFHGLGIAEDKISETEMLIKCCLQVVIEFFRVFIYKSSATHISINFAFRFTGIKYQRHVVIYPTNGLKQFVACKFIRLLCTCGDRETAITDNAQNIIAIPAIE